MLALGDGSKINEKFLLFSKEIRSW